MSEEIPNWKREAAADLTQKREALLERRRKEIEAHKVRVRQYDDELSEFSVSARSLDLPVSWLDRPEQNKNKQQDPNIIPANPARMLEIPRIAAKPSNATFKDSALAFLKGFYPDPIKAAMLQEMIELTTGLKYHEKTAGMTLYRLSQEGLARREGHWWYFVPEDQQNKENPEEGDQPKSSGHSIFD